ncbi:MAG: 2,3-bisphosphoglycerate-independent phosphoglycerate mutase [Sphingobacteriales bacterium]|jgi:2,3-bisphosphoglycerate-independent phosphoglycerate mutase
MTIQKTALLILDGWGIGTNPKIDATKAAKTPFFDHLMESYSHTKLHACGKYVGLPEGQMGNSEVGHLNIGAGRVVFQELARINNSIKTGEFQNNKILINHLKKAKNEGRKVHFIGLLSDGGVHSHQNHLYALCEIAKELEIPNTYIHAFLDGRDTDPTNGKKYVAQLLEHCAKTKVQLASIIGRYYAMDRDHRWERVKKAYDLLVSGMGISTTDPIKTINEQYSKGITDEFMEAISVSKDTNSNPITIEAKDLVICFNFRTDRARQLITALCQKDIPNAEMKKLPLSVVTFTQYDATFKNVAVLFTKDNLKNTLGEVLSDNNLNQIRMAETEKYPHVTFFFSGGREHPFVGEKRILKNSPKVATYDLQPEMSAMELTESLKVEFSKQNAHFICLNFANPDMVGHTGVFDAVVKSCETVDTCLKEVVTSGLENGYQFIVIADHGNADFMLNEDGSPNTAHSLNLVPCIAIGDNLKLQQVQGKLADVAPTILEIMGVKQPKEMTGKSLLN